MLLPNGTYLDWKRRFIVCKTLTQGSEINAVMCPQHQPNQALLDRPEASSLFNTDHILRFSVSSFSCSFLGVETRKGRFEPLQL